MTLCKALNCPALVLGGMAAISALALAAAYTGQYVFGLAPCILCLYQRIPYAAVVVLGLIGLGLRKNRHAAAIVILLCAAAFLANTGIAFYHTGVEQHWWLAGPEGCAADFGNTEKSGLLDAILSAPAKRCDEIAWTDPIFGLSMANYNVLMCLALAAICLISFVRIWVTPRPGH